MEENVVLTARGITMTFPGVRALENVDFTLRRGEIHALMGENGAGKSTLIKCLTGINDFEAGEIHIAREKPFHKRRTERRHIDCVSGGQSLPEPLGCGEFVYRKRADDGFPYH